MDEDGKPIFSDDEIINEIDYDDCNWDEWPVGGDSKSEKKKKKNKKKSKESSDDEKDPEFEVKML